MVTQANSEAVELQTEVMVPIVTATDDASSATGTLMHWEYLDSNTVRDHPHITSSLFDTTPSPNIILLNIPSI